MTVFAFLFILTLAGPCIFFPKSTFATLTFLEKDEESFIPDLSMDNTLKMLLSQGWGVVSMKNSLMTYINTVASVHNDIRSTLKENSIALDTLISHLKDLCPQAGPSADPQKSIDYTSCETILKSPVIQLIQVDKVDMSNAGDSEQLKSLYPVFRAGAKFAYEAFINDRSWKESVPKFQKYLKATCERERVLLKVFKERGLQLESLIEMYDTKFGGKLPLLTVESFLRGVLSENSHLELEKKIDLATWKSSGNFYIARDLVKNGCNFGSRYMTNHVKKELDSMRKTLIELLKQNDDFYKRLSDSPLTQSEVLSTRGPNTPISRIQAMIDRYMIRDMKRFSMISNALNSCTQKLIIENAEEYSSLNSNPTLEIIVDNFSLLKSYSTKFRHPLLDRIPEAIDFIEHAMYDLSSAIVPNTILYDKLSKKMDFKVNLTVESFEAIRPNFHLLSDKDKLNVLDEELKKFEPAIKLLDDSSQTIPLEDLKRMATLVLAKQNVIQSLIRNYAKAIEEPSDTKFPFFVYSLDKNRLHFDTTFEREIAAEMNLTKANPKTNPSFFLHFIRKLNDYLGFLLEKFKHNAGLFDKLAVFMDPLNLSFDCRSCDSILKSQAISEEQVSDQSSPKLLFDQLFFLDQKVQEFEFLSQAFFFNDQNPSQSCIMEGIKFICEREKVLLEIHDLCRSKMERALSSYYNCSEKEKKTRTIPATQNLLIAAVKCDNSYFPKVKDLEALTSFSTQLFKAYQSSPLSISDLFALKEALNKDSISLSQLLSTSSSSRGTLIIKNFLFRNSYRLAFVEKRLQAMK